VVEKDDHFLMDHLLLMVQLMIVSSLEEEVCSHDPMEI